MAERAKSCILSFCKTCLTLVGVTMILLTLGAHPASAEKVTQSQNLNQSDVGEQTTESVTQSQKLKQSDVGEQTASCAGRSAPSEQVQDMEQSNDAVMSNGHSQPPGVRQRNAATQISTCGSVPPEVPCRHEQMVTQRNGEPHIILDIGGC